MRVLHVEDEEMQRIVAAEGLEVLHPEYGTAPRVYYRNLKRFRSLFIGGTVAGAIAGVVECVDGARATLECGGRVVASARSDAYGDFKFGGLDAAGGAYRLTIADERFAPVTVDVDLRGQSVYLGAIELVPHPPSARQAAGDSEHNAVPTH
jgi:hypothetical protein